MNVISERIQVCSILIVMGFSPKKKKKICQHGSNFLHQGDLFLLVNTSLIGPMDTQIRFTRKMSVLLVFIKWIYQSLQTLNTLQSILGYIRPCLLENACILYVAVYNFTRFRWAENCTPQDHFCCVMIVPLHSHTSKDKVCLNSSKVKEEHVCNSHFILRRVHCLLSSY